MLFGLAAVQPLCTAFAETRSTPAQVAADVARMQALVADCQAQPSACDASKVAEDREVGDPANGGFAVHWQWLRDVLKQASAAASETTAASPAAASSSAAKTAAADRTTSREQLVLAAARLQAMAAPPSAAAEAATAAEFERAHTAAESVLRRPEFRPDEPTWWDRQKSRWLGWLAQLFEGLNSVGERAPFLGPLLEWLFFGGAAVGLIYFLVRAAERQRRRVVLNEAALPLSAWEVAATDWQQQAARAAERQQWREALHCLYWSAIVLLEVRRMWRHNPSRTPREYVRLLKPGSAEHEGLGGLTRAFEQVWYGQREAGEREYEQARLCYLKLAGLQLSGGDAGRAGGRA